MIEYTRLNKRKREQCEKEGIRFDRAEEFSELGDGSPLYRYVDGCGVIAEELIADDRDADILYERLVTVSLPTMLHP